MNHPLCTSLFLLLTLASASADDLQLFNGHDLSAWKAPLGTWSVAGRVSLDATQPQSYAVKVGEGVTLNTASGKTLDITSIAEHGDAQIHVEFNVPKGSNSGIYLQGRYEIQIFDSYGKPDIAEHDCGALYQRWDPSRGKGNEGYEGHIPKVNASLAPGEWQTFDITYRAPRFDTSGKKIENARFVKVIHNGKIIHENAEMTGPTRGAKFTSEAPMGPIIIQGNHGPVAFRKLTVTPISGATTVK
jgi:hypothetical protein